MVNYDKEFIENKIKNCVSIASAVKALGYKSTNSNKKLRNIIKEILDKNNTYKGQAHSKNKNYIKKSNDEYFKNDISNKKNSSAVKNTLFTRGLKERICERCKNTEWCGNPIPLELHHKDGKKYNNELSNLEILCPNCHCFTDTYKFKNVKNKKHSQKKEKKIKKKKIIDINYLNSRKKTRKIERPSYEILKQEIKETSYCAVGRKYNVSDNCIRRWIKIYEKYENIAETV